MPPTALNAERKRLAEDAERLANWKRWGPYLSERQWGTVREDYSADGSVWTYFPFEHSHIRAYRWGEDGILGVCDRQCRLCFSLAMWNERDPILKERLFGLTGPQGNHGEDVKERYFYVASTPTHSYLRGVYHYPQAEFPYQLLRAENERRGLDQGEFELAHTGVFDENRYFEIAAEYAKAEPNDLLIRITARNAGPDAAPLHLLPTLWFRNTWTWGHSHEDAVTKPLIDRATDGTLVAQHLTLGRYELHLEPDAEGRQPTVLMTDNETNYKALWNTTNHSPYVKDAFGQYIVHGKKEAVNPDQCGTKAAAHYRMILQPGESTTLRLRLCDGGLGVRKPFGAAFDKMFERNKSEARAFFDSLIPAKLEGEHRRIADQAYAGLLWSRQFYHYAVSDWLRGDPAFDRPPPQRKRGRNSDWEHLYNRDVISMPDKWEYPWYAAWDLAFHMIPMARVDPHFAKQQLILMLREWYMHPNGQIPAYEFAFGDVNPPVHAWACWRVYKMTAPRGKRDVEFLKRVFQKLLINFTWWVNRKDVHGRHLFSGGFLGLDNIGVFDRSAPLPTGGALQQADATAWMAFYCGTMLSMALELAHHDRAYEDVASKFFEHFVAIADAMNHLGGSGLWDAQDGFYYDQIRLDDVSVPLKIRSMVGLIPLIAVEVLPDDHLERLGGFRKRMDWFLQHRHDLAEQIAYMVADKAHGHHLLAIPSKQRLQSVLRYLLDESEFLSPFGIRSMSRHHLDHPFIFDVDGRLHEVRYVSGESQSRMFGGNSNWRGPIWFPVNYLLIEALERYHYFYGDDLTVECPNGSGRTMTLRQVARELTRRLIRLFERDALGRRPCHGDEPIDDYVLFHEYFDGDNGRGLGASHQTGWTALIARCLEDMVTKFAD